MRISAAWAVLVSVVFLAGCAGRGYYPPYEGGSWSTVEYGGDKESYAEDYTGYVKAEQSQAQSSSQTQASEVAVKIIDSLPAQAPAVTSTAFSAEQEWDLGVAAEGRGDCNGARRRFSALERKGLPPTAAALRAMGRCHMRLGANDKAAEAFAGAMKEERYRRDADMHRMLTAAYLRLERCDLAMKSAADGLELFPEDQTLLKQLARCRKQVRVEAGDDMKESKEALKESEKETREEAREEKREAKEEGKEAKDIAKEEAKEIREEAREEVREEQREAKEEAKEAKEAKEDLKEKKQQAKKEAKELKKEAEEKEKKAKKDAKSSKKD